jgi:hypothetical protein
MRIFNGAFIPLETAKISVLMMSFMILNHFLNSGVVFLNSNRFLAGIHTFYIALIFELDIYKRGVTYKCRLKIRT